MSHPGPRRQAGVDELRPTITQRGSRRFVRRAGLRWEDGHLVAVDADGREHRFPDARSIVLQHDLAVGVLSVYGAHDSLMVLDEEGRVLASAPKGPFDPADVEAFCRAHGLSLLRTQRSSGEPTMPAKAPGYRGLDVTRRTSVIVMAVLVATAALALVGPFHPLAVIGAGVVVAFVVLIAIS